MALALTFDDFKTFSITCELRYLNAYLIFDRTGIVISDMKDSFTNVIISNAGPQQTAFASDEGTFHIEIGAARFTSGRLEKGGEKFAQYCKAYFDSVTERLQIDILTRIGLRYILRKEFKSDEEAKTALAAMALANLKPAKRFNSSDSPTEIMFRWEDTEIGALVRLKAETYEVKLAVPPELRDVVPNYDRKSFGLTVDVDYYTVAPVEREQWNVLEWLPLKVRIIRKEVEGILQGGSK
jgi:uncharacterized protein (TIGR04255 family)